MSGPRDERTTGLQQLALACCLEEADELAALLAAMERRHRERKSNEDTIKHVRQTFAAAREIGIRTLADLEDRDIDRRFSEGIAGLKRPDGGPRWADATRDLMRRHLRSSIRFAGKMGLLRPPSGLASLGRPGDLEWRRDHPQTARTRRPDETDLLLLEAHLQERDDTWTGLRIHALEMVEKETGMPLASALRLIPADVDLTFHHHIRYFPRRSGRARFAETSLRLERVIRPWLDHCGPFYFFPNHSRLAPWDEVSARRDLKDRCIAAGTARSITFEQLQLCAGRPDPREVGGRSGDRAAVARVAEAAAASGIDFDGLAEALRDRGDKLSSRLVALMKDRAAASFDDVMERACGGERAESSIRALVNRTNNAVGELEPRLKFTTAECQVLRHIIPQPAPPAAGDADATGVQQAVQRPCNDGG